jgi:hypothetical protein
VWDLKLDRLDSLADLVHRKVFLNINLVVWNGQQYCSDPGPAKVFSLLENRATMNSNRRAVKDSHWSQVAIKDTYNSAPTE